MSRFLIAVDLDDVLCCTSEAAAMWHNKTYNTRLTLSDFHYYHWWKDPGWGTPDETATKVDKFYSSADFLDALPVAGAASATAELKRMGFGLTVLTARSIHFREPTLTWLGKWFPKGTFDHVYFAEDLKHVENKAEEGWSWPTKVDMCLRIGAGLLIDDAIENVLGCAEKQLPALLFGDYEWGKRISTAEDKRSFEERLREQVRNGLRSDWWQEDVVDLPDCVWSVKDWREVITWIQGPGEPYWTNLWLTTQRMIV